MLKSRWITILIVAVSVTCQAQAAKGEKVNPRKLMLAGGYPAISEEHAALTEVPYAEGAPAVVLLEAVEYDWDGLESRRDRFFRRLKILDEDAIEDYGSFRYTLYGDLHIASIDARTVLPDGTVVNAKEGINREKSDDGMQMIQIAFPQVQVGAILDLDIQYTSSAWSVEPWTIQEWIPILETRFVMKPPTGLRFRIMPYRLPPEKTQPDYAVSVAGGGKAYIWHFRDVKALPDIAHLPPMEDVSQRLFVILQQYKDAYNFIPIAADWKTWGERRNENWEEWFKRDHDAVAALAKELAPAEGDALQKAEAIRQGLHERMRISRVNRFYGEDTPDQELNSGSASTGAMAGLAVVMLRAVGVDADLVAIRRRSDGIAPVEFPIPRLMNDLMVRIPDGRGGTTFFTPSSEQDVKRLPFDFSGILAFPLDGEAAQPVPVPDFKAVQNQTRRMVRATLHPDGKLEGKSTETFAGVAAERWGNRLRDDSEDERRERIERSLQRALPGLALNSLEITGLEEGAKRISFKCEWEVEGFATVAGSRLIFNPNLFGKLAADDWASETREYDIDLGANYETQDTFMLRMPENVAEVTVADPISLTADPPVGLHEASYTFRGETLVVKRHHRIDIYRIPAKYYGDVRQWFSQIAATDEKPAVVELQ
jgi:hypothetical protein